METVIAILLIIIPLIVIVVIGVAFDRRANKHTVKQGDQLEKYLGKE